MSADRDQLSSSTIVETDMASFEGALDEEFCHFGVKHSAAMGCGIPRCECSTHGRKVWPADYERGTCAEHGRPFCPGCMARYWDLWS